MANYFAPVLAIVFAVNAGVCVCAEAIPETSDPHAHHQTEDCLHSDCVGECGEEIALQANTSDKPGTPLKVVDNKVADNDDAKGKDRFLAPTTRLLRNTDPPDLISSVHISRLHTPITRKDRLVV